MYNSQNEIKAFNLVDEYLTKLKKEQLQILEVKNKPPEYNVALNIIIEHNLIQQIRNNKYSLSEVGKQVINSGGIQKNIALLINKKELDNDIRLKRIQLDIGKHVESRSFNLKLIIISILLLLFLIVIKFFFF